MKITFGKVKKYSGSLLQLVIIFKDYIPTEEPIGFYIRLHNLFLQIIADNAVQLVIAATVTVQIVAIPILLVIRMIILWLMAL